MPREGIIHLRSLSAADVFHMLRQRHQICRTRSTANLLGTNISLLQQALCSRPMKLKGSEMQIPLKPGEACSSRDALAKAIYLKLFGWVVTQVNSSLLDAKVTPLPRPHSHPRPHPHPRSHL